MVSEQRALGQVFITSKNYGYPQEPHLRSKEQAKLVRFQRSDGEQKKKSEPARPNAKHSQIAFHLSINNIYK